MVMENQVIGPQLSTIRSNGRAYKGRQIWLITVPSELLWEAEKKGVIFEHLDKIRITIEKVGTKANPRPHAWNAHLKKKVVETSTDENS